jgi:hypothetical protein
MTRYILDTSAVRSVGRARLQAAREAGHELLISTISLWELLSHLGDENFALAKANALKAQLCTVLHDPLAEMMDDVGCPEAAHPGRFDEREGVLALLSALESAESYEDFQNREITFRGETRSARDLSANIVRVFDAEHQTFVEGMQQRCANYVERFGRGNAINLDGEQFCREATRLARRLKEDTENAGCDVPFATLVNRTLLGAGYAVARACAYIGNVPEGQQAQVDPNDLEDHLISLHVGAVCGRTFVTNDRGTRTAIDRTLAAFHAFAEAEGETFTTTGRVIDGAAFIAEACPAPPPAQQE